MSRLSLDFISVLAMPPVDHIKLAADLGCGGISIALAPFTANPHGYPSWSLRDDAGLRGEVKRARADTGLHIGLGEGYLVREGMDVANSASDMDLMAELGVERVNILSIDPDHARVSDQLATFAEMAAARNMGATLEYMAGMPIGSLPAAVAAVREVGHENLKIMIDCLHLARGGNSPADLAAIDPTLIGYLQLCDAKDKPLDASYGEDAKHNRMALGDGDLPLAEIVAACPAGITCGIELPMLARAEAGEGPEARLASSVAFAKRLLGEA